MRRSLCAFTFAALSAATLGAQTTASILGTVTDDSGAVIAGAQVRAVNTLTNETRSTVTNELGYYSFPELPVGVYTVQAEREGFKTAVREGITLSLNRNARVDMRLALGALTERVNVFADAPLVETTTNEMGSLVDQRRVAELPLNGRNTLSLISLVPGAQRLETGNAQGFVENKANVNGQRMEDSNWLLDGGDNTSPLRNYGNDVPNPDAIQEFRVITNNYGAEYGRTAGAVVNVITRSGTNQFHGTAFEYLRNRALNARNFFQTSTLPLVQNQYGGTLGGPVIRNKTFFFGTYQGFKRRTTDFRNSALVPTAAERSGDFSQSVDRAGKPITVKDPRTNQPFPGNLIPTARLSPVAQNFLKLAIPLPNYPATGPNGLYQTASKGSDNNQWLAKLDHQFSDRHKLSGAYFWSDSVEHQRFVKEIDFARREMKTRQHNLNLHEYWMISPTKLNHFRATFARSAGNRLVLPDNVTMTDLGSKFSPLPDGPLMPPAVAVSGYFDATSVNGGPKTANHYNLADTFSWTRGRHDLKFGAEGWLRRLFDVSTNPRQAGEWTIDGSFSGNALGDLMLGLVRQVVVGPQNYKSQNSWAWYGFVQDRLRLSTKLALTLGLRYELDTWPVHPLDQLVAWRPGMQSSCVPQAPPGVVFPCDPGIPRAGVPNDTNNFAPRFGLAYDLFGNGRTVLRAGYGVSYTFSYLNALQDQQVSTPFSYQNTIRNTTFEDPYAPLGANPFPFRKDPANLVFAPGANYGFQSADMRTGYVQQYNFSFQRQIGADWSIEAAYVGNLGRKLMGRTDINSAMRRPDATSANINQRRPLWPTFQTINMRSSFVNSSYNGLQTRVERRFNHGITLLGSYTWSKWIDFASWYDDTSFFADQRNVRLDRGRGEQDQRQVFALSWVWEPRAFAGATGFKRAVLDGWNVNGILSFYGGQPLRIRSDRDNDFDGYPNADRPDVVGDWKLSPNRSRAEVIDAWFNPRAFAPNQAGQLGNLGRNVVSGPGFKGLDLGVVKNFRVREGHQMQFRAESFNTFNWVNLGDPEVRITRATFGRITSTAVSTTAATSQRDARVFQFGLKYVF
jgi:hypothetical protein